MKRFGVALFAGMLLVNGAFAQSPSISQAIPGAVKPGTSTQIALKGSNLKDVTGLWTSFSALSQFTGSSEQDANGLVCNLTVPANAPVGIGAIRVATKQGISSSYFFMVDDLPSIRSIDTNRTTAAAQRILPPIAVEGTTDDGAFDFFKFSAKAGQTISFEIVAQRLGSKLDPVLRLLDSTGRELAYCDDDPGIGGDSRFIHKFAAKGDYVLEVRDINYQGGAQYKYRLRIGDFPLATVPYPLAAKGGTRAELLLGGRGIASTKPVSVVMPEKFAALPISVKNPRGVSSGFLSALVSRGEEAVETEPNDAANSANTITIPTAINGRFGKSKDRDYYQFEAKKGQKVLITTKTRSLGSPSELLVQLQKPDGTLIADASEGIATNTFSEAGTYRLLVEDIMRRGGPDQGYRVEIEPFEGFSLSVDSDKVESPAGASFSLKVTCVRRDYKGPIALALDGIEGATSKTNVIAEGKNDVTLEVAIPAKMQVGDWAIFSLSGSARMQDGDYIARVSTLSALRTMYPPLPNPPLHLDGFMGLGVTAPKPVEKK